MSGDTFDFFPCGYEYARTLGCWRAVATRIVDGDTYDCVCDLGATARIKLRLRLKDFDTPEFFHPENPAELEHAKQAIAFVTDLLLDKPCLVRTFRTRTGTDLVTVGRYVAKILVLGADFLWHDIVPLLREAGMEKRASYL